MARTKKPSSKTLRVLFTAAEADPIIKVGGLGDVSGTLPRVIQELAPAEALGYQVDVRLVIPFHPVIKTRIQDYEPVASFQVPHPDGAVEAQAFTTRIGDLPVYLIAGGPIEEAEKVYSVVSPREDGDKFAFFSLAVLELARALDWQPHILHANDWHTALSAYTLKQTRGNGAFFASTRSMLTIHNLGFMGAGTWEEVKEYGIPRLEDEYLPEWAEIQPLPMGLATADHLTTVSPTYAREIMTPEFGYGLEDLLRHRKEDISGILNGLDEASWDPRSDPALAANYGCETLELRMANKQALLREFSLPPNLDLPLLIIVSRLDNQKGIDLAIEALRMTAGVPWQAIILGSGDPVLEAAARQLEADFPYRARAALRFDAQLSRRMYGGGDMILIPSRYEPCGLTQMIGMRYGCVPVARATGGLSDTVLDTAEPETSTGFLFEDATAAALATALRRAITAFGDPGGWKARQLCGMQQDFSWKRSAQAYVEIYDRLLGNSLF